MARVPMDWNGAILWTMADPLASRLGANVAQLREVRGLTQSQMAKVAGVPRAT